jgi:hypothetical protein
VGEKEEEFTRSIISKCRSISHPRTRQGTYRERPP